MDDFRGAYQYNLADAHMRRFNAETAQIVQWDDHEVRDNWYPTRDLSRGREVPRSKSMALIAERARQAFLEYNPVPVSADETGPRLPHRRLRPARRGLRARPAQLPRAEQREPPADAGRGRRRSPAPAQLAWLKARLARVARDLEGHRQRHADRPRRAATRRRYFEAFANGDDGPPLGRELELADLLRFMKTQRIRNVVWVTADVHYCAAHHYHPTRAKFTDFDPFWEFVAGPLNAGTFGPNKMDAHVRPGSEVHRHPAGHEAEPPAERRASSSSARCASTAARRR